MSIFSGLFRARGQPQKELPETLYIISDHRGAGLARGKPESGPIFDCGLIQSIHS